MASTSPRQVTSRSSASRRERLPRAQRERQILDVAHAHFAAHGYAAVTMDELATAVGVTKPLLYAYFGNKERLYLACLERAGEALQATVAEAFAAADDPGESLRAGVRAFFDFLDADRAGWQVLFDETLPAGGEIAHRVAEHRDRLTGLAGGTIERLLPDLAAPERDALAHALLGAAEALARWWLAAGGLTAREAADLLITTVEPGLGRRALARRGAALTLRPRTVK